MALFESVSDEPTPWVFPEQRDEDFKGVVSIVHLRPMSYKEWTTYSMRRAEAEESRKLPVEQRAERVTTIDQETIRSVVMRAESIYRDGDNLTEAEDLGKFVEKLDWTRAQQILFAVRSASALKAGAKNS